MYVSVRECACVYVSVRVCACTHAPGLALALFTRFCPYAQDGRASPLLCTQCWGSTLARSRCWVTLSTQMGQRRNPGQAAGAASAAIGSYTWVSLSSTRSVSYPPASRAEQEEAAGPDCRTCPIPSLSLPHCVPGRIQSPPRHKNR